MKKVLNKFSFLFFCVMFSFHVWAAQPIQEKHIAGGLFYSLFVSPDGNVWVWGLSNLSGDRNERYPSVAMKEGGSVFANFNDNTIFVIKQDGSLWGWGNTDSGQLGTVRKDSKTISRFMGMPVEVLKDAIFVTGTNTVLAIKPDLTLWGWGDWGPQRGDNDQKDITVPRKIMNGVVQVSSNRYHTLALQKDGTLWAWGDNQCGALGIGNRKEHVRPVKVNLKPLGKRKVARIAVRWGESYIVADDGTVWYSGEFNIRQDECLDPPRLIPTRIAGLDNVADIALGQYHELYLKKDGSVWVSGYGKAAASSLMTVPKGPRKIMDHVREIAAGDLHSIVLKKDGSVWTWGINKDGQLGNGTTQGSAVPVQVFFPKK